MTQMSEHFSFAEFTKTNTGLPNVPDDAQIAAGKYVAETILEPVRAHFVAKYPDRHIAVAVNSWFRCSEVNVAAGSKVTSTSQHLFGEAVDFEIPGVPNSEIWQFIESSGLAFDQLIAEKLTHSNGSDGWIHCSAKVGRARKDAISYIGNNVYKPGLVFIG